MGEPVGGGGVPPAVESWASQAVRPASPRSAEVHAVHGGEHMVVHCPYSTLIVSRQKRLDRGVMQTLYFCYEQAADGVTKT